jgi:indole-3-glycerol phosphate synthase
LAAAIEEPGLSIIAEVKRRSPSRGDLAPGLDPAAVARSYEQGGAAAISVLTEPEFFGGSTEDLRAVREAVSLPLLRKDFILHPLQVWESRAIGAGAVLLIVAALDDGLLALLLETAAEASLDALVEVHTAEEAKRAIVAGATIVGVNNRDLATFGVDLAIAEALAAEIAEVPLRVAESGIFTGSDATRMKAAGYQAVLVGEALVRAGDPAALIGELRR